MARLDQTVRPRVNVTVRGRVTRRMKLGLAVMRFGAWLVNRGGVKVTAA